MDFREQLKGFRIINPTHIQLVSYNYKKSYIFHENTSKYCPNCDSYTDSNKILKLYDKSK